MHIAQEQLVGRGCTNNLQMSSMHIDRVIMSTGKLGIGNIYQSTAAGNLDKVGKSCIGSATSLFWCKPAAVDRNVFRNLTYNTEVAEIIDTYIVQTNIL